MNLIKEKGYLLTHVIDTHTHADHISAGSALKDATGCEYVMHENAPAKCVSVRVKDGDKLKINDMDIDITHTPGHTNDSISLVIGDKMFTGDFIFLDDAGAGRDDLPGGSPAAHWESLSKISDFSDQLIVYPAHEYRDRKPSSLGRQREINPHFKPRTKDEFVTYLEDLKLGPADWMKDVLKANYTCAKDPNSAWIPVDAPACEIKGTLDESVNEIEVEYINAIDFLKERNSGIKATLIDVREPEELISDLGQIDGVLNIPIGSLSGKLSELEQYKNDYIVVVCRSGARATTGAQILKKSGFNNVKVLKGGMLDYNKVK